MLPIVVLLTSLASTAYAQDWTDIPPRRQVQLIEWIACPLDTTVNDTPYFIPTLQCGTIDVPNDYTDPSSATLTIPLIRIPANSSQPLNHTIIFNPGGPGGSGVKSLIDFSDALRTVSGGGYDLVSFDPRGTGLTRPYTCPTLDDLDITVANYGAPIDNPAGLNASYVHEALQGEVCAEEPYLLDGETMGTAFVVRDIKAISEAVGQDGLIRYWGISYGTLLGATLAATYPDLIDRMVLDGNINPTDYYHGLGDEAAADVDREISYFFQACSEAGPDYCAYADPKNKTGPELEATFNDWLASLKNGSVETFDTDETPLSYTDVKGSMFGDLYSASSFPDLAVKLQNWTQATKASTDHTKRAEIFNVTAKFGVQSPNIVSAVTCGEWDDIPAGDLNDFKELLEVYNKRSKFGADQLINIVFSCATWNVTAKEVFGGKFTNITTKTPVLFVNSDLDPVTPLISAQNSSSGYVGSVVVKHHGAGHGAFSHPSKCVFRKINSYWVNGTMPDVSEFCEPDVQPFLAAVVTSGNINDTVPNASNGTASKELEDDELNNKAFLDIHTIKPGPGVIPFTFPFAEVKAKRDMKRAADMPQPVAKHRRSRV